MKPCRIAMMAFIFGDIPIGIENGYTKDDLIALIDYCQALIDEGLVTEPHDNFNLKDCIQWANKLLI